MLLFTIQSCGQNSKKQNGRENDISTSVEADYLINDINLQTSDENIEQQHNILNFDSLNMTAWSNDCNSGNQNSQVYFSVVGGQFTFPSRFIMNTTLKQVDNREIGVYFSYPIVRPIPVNMQDCRDYSEEIPIGKIEALGEKIKFTWYGFYNNKTKKKVHVENPFNKKEYVVLEKCSRKKH